MSNNNHLHSLQELIEIMALLRSEDGCKWDRQQTPESLKKHILEETYELLEAIDNGNPDEICDELGDLLLQVVFQAQIFAESEQFSISEVAQSISDKLKRRHPHIFSDASHEGHEQRWEEIKQQERSARGKSNRLAERIPPTLPALARSVKLAKKNSPAKPLELIEQMQKQLQSMADLLHPQCADRSSLDNHLSQLLVNICRFSAANDLDAEDLLRKKTTQLISEIDSENNLY